MSLEIKLRNFKGKLGFCISTPLFVFKRREGKNGLCKHPKVEE